MMVFMVERDLKGISATDLHDITTAATRQAALMYENGDRVRYIRTAFVPDDGRCLCLFEAKNADVVRQLNIDAKLPFFGVVQALDLVP